MTEPPDDLDEAITVAAKQRLWLMGDLTWMLHDAQLVIHGGIESLPPAVKEAVLLCCRRFGKSYYGVVRGLMRGIMAWASGSAKLIRIVGPTIDQTQGIVDYNMAKITAELPALGLRGLVERVKSDKMYRIGGSTGSALFLGGFDSQEDSLRGGEAHEILIEETGSSDPDQYSYQMRSVLKPQLLKTRGRMIHLTTLPPVPDHPFTNETIPAAKMDGAFYSFTIYEDPLATPEIIAEAIKDCGGVHTIDFKREYLNEETRDPRIVVCPDFDPKRHVKPHHPPHAGFGHVTTDMGGVRDLTVSLLHYYDFQRHKVVFYRERWHPRNTPTSVIVAAARALEAETPDGIEIVSRPADIPGQIQVDLQQQGYDTVSPLKEDWQANVNNLALGFTRDEIIVDPACKLLIQTLTSGLLNKQRTDFARSDTLGHCDAIDAAMYGIRAQDRANPFPKINPHRDSYFVRQQPTEEDAELAMVIQPKSFGNGPKKFGSFR